MRTRTIQIGIGIAMLLMMMPASTFACSCPSFGPPSRTEKEYADILLDGSGGAFYGKVVGVKDGPTPETHIARFQVSRSWRYRLEEFVDVTARKDSAACGIEFEIGDEYLLLLRFTSRSKVSASLCQLHSKTLIGSFGEGFKPKKSTAK
jgi:hypothetical protein